MILCPILFHWYTRYASHKIIRPLLSYYMCEYRITECWDLSINLFANGGFIGYHNGKLGATSDKASTMIFWGLSVHMRSMFHMDSIICLHCLDLDVISVQISNYRADSRFAPSQWETALLCNDVSHWLGASLESHLNYIPNYYVGCNYLSMPIPSFCAKVFICENTTFVTYVSFSHNYSAWNMPTISFWFGLSFFY